MKNYTIDMIQAMTETDAAAIALEKLDVKGHTVYLVDFGGYFGYSCLVFKNGHHIYYANDYELHHKWRKATQKQLREVYVEKLGNILFTLEEIASPLSDYAEYERRSRYLHNYYGMQEDNISLFDAGGTKQEVEERKKKIATMIFNPVGFAYYTNADFVREHVALFQRFQMLPPARHSAAVPGNPDRLEDGVPQLFHRLFPRAVREHLRCPGGDRDGGDTPGHGVAHLQIPVLM